MIPKLEDEAVTKVTGKILGKYPEIKMAISKTSCAALVKSIVALIFAVWPLVFPANGESHTGCYV